jgi:polysaccharide biosynthesis transport protein
MPHDPSPEAEGYAPTSEQHEAFDVRAYWRAIVRRRWLLVPFFVATVLVTALVTLRQTKIYDATCTIVIDLSAPKVLDTEVKDVVETGSGGVWFSREYYETQYKVILSRAVAQRVADKLQLGSNPAFLGLDEVKDPALRERLRLRADPVAILQKSLKVEPIRDSRIVRIRFESRDPEMAALLANAVAEAYIAENLAVKTSTTQSASEWLEQQLADLEVKLAKSGKELFDFKKQHDIVATSWEDRQGMVSQRLTAINDALTKASVQRAQLEARNEAIGRLLADLDGRLDEEAESVEPVATSQAIQQLKVRYLEARSECADLKLRYLEHHPKLEACETKASLARSSLQGEIRARLLAARREYQEAVKTQQNLRALLNDTKSDAFALNQYEREYVELKRAHDNNQRIYDVLIKRLKDAGVTGMLQASNVRILDRARPGSTPVRPNVGQNLLLAIVFGLLGGVALAFAAEYLDTSITSQQQIEERLGLTFLGIIPSIEKNSDGTPQDLVVHARPQSVAAECLRAIRTNLLFMSPDKPLRTILVTSSGPQEGKTTTAVTLAEVMADSGNRVLLLDADMRRPRLHRVFDVTNAEGLSSLILGEGSLDSIVKSTLVPNLFVLPCGPIPPNPAELLHTEAFGTLLADLAKRFDRVIIDSPPVSVVSDAVVMSTRVDGTLMVLKAGLTSREVARQAVRSLRDVKARVFGAVLNDLDLEDQKYGQFRHYHYYQYSYYYGDKQKTDPQAAA